MKIYPYILLLFVPYNLASQNLDSPLINSIDSLLEVSGELGGNQEFEKAFEIVAAVEKLVLEKLGKETLSYAKVCINKGKLYYYNSEYVKAQNWLLESKIILDKLNDKEPELYALNLHLLGVVYYATSKYELAEQYYLESMAIREKIIGKNHPEFAASLMNLGLVYTDSGNFEKAEPIYLEVIALFEIRLKNKEHPLYLNCLNNLAILYYQMGKYDKAEPLALEAKNIRAINPGKEHPDYAQSLNNLSVLYTSMGNYEKAELFSVESKAILEKTIGKEHPHYASCLASLANLYFYMKDYNKALSLELEANQINEKVYGKIHPEYALALNNLGNSYMELGQYQKAEVSYLESKLIYEKIHGKEHADYAWSLGNLANLYIELGMYEKALQHSIEAKSIREKVLGKTHPHYIESLNPLAYLLEFQKQYASSDSLLTESNELTKDQLSKATSYLSEQELSKFISTFQNNGSEIGNYLLTRQLNGINLGSLPGLAFDHVLFYKGFLLTAAKRLKSLASSTHQSNELLQKLKGLRRRIVANYSLPIAEQTEIAALEELANLTEKELSQMVIGYNEVNKQVKWKDIQSKLKKDEAAIEFIHFRRQFPTKTDSVLYVALLLKQGSFPVEFILLFEEKALGSLIHATSVRKADYVNALYTHENRGAFIGEEAKRSLYELLWQPMEKSLEGIQTIYFAPSGLLHRINFDAIPIRENETLADKYKMVQLNSTRQLAIEEPMLPNKQDAILFGGIYFEQDSASNSNAPFYASRSESEVSFRYVDSSLRGGSWNYLPGTEREVNAIDKIMQNAGIQTTLKNKYSATEESFKNIGTALQNSPKILHIATHGYFFADSKREINIQPTGTESSQTSLGKNDKTPDESVFKISDHPLLRAGLILSGGNAGWRGERSIDSGEDGVLTAYEISLMNLSNTELVVLSACETGLGDIQGNEGVYGLQRAFKIAGAKYIIMSLWQVPDKQTSMLMITFYKKWLEHKMTIPDAFRAAQKELRDLGLDPYQWAGFVLVE